MAGSEDYIAADPENLIRGGVDLATVSDIIAALLEDMEWTAAHFSYSAGGAGHITHLLEKNYKPSAEASREFVRMLKTLILDHGGSVVGSGQVLAAADDSAIDSAGGRRGG
ncbi:hypothetical protein ACN27F_02855 [Solwaraspora sp. WMMB335]|uniref:hypothetical protein n=1 Tax=Solwaraspora sp. WMMB335 TaxID=3404118 RepID=UPI003B963810